MTELYTRDNINLIHITAVAPLLGYIAYVGYNEEPLDMAFVWILFIIALVIVVWHGYLYYDRNFTSKKVVLGEEITDLAE